MNYDQNHLWPENLQFTHTFKGYNPQEVERAMKAHEKSKSMISKQIRDLQSENTQLTDLLDEYRDKVQKLVLNMNRIDEERAREKLYLAEIMTNAGKSAEKTISEAQQKSERIIADAQRMARQIQQKAETDTKASRDELNKLAGVVKSAKETLVQYFETLEDFLRGITDVVQIYKQSESVSEQEYTTPLKPGATADAIYREPVRAEQAASMLAWLEEEEGPYEKWLREQEPASNGGASFEKAEPPGKVIGHFGDV